MDITLKEIHGQHQRQHNEINPTQHASIIFGRDLDASLRRYSEPSHQISRGISVASPFAIGISGRMPVSIFSFQQGMLVI